MTAPAPTTGAPRRRRRHLLGAVRLATATTTSPCSRASASAAARSAPGRPGCGPRAAGRDAVPGRGGRGRCGAPPARRRRRGRPPRRHASRGRCRWPACGRASAAPRRSGRRGAADGSRRGNAEGAQRAAVGGELGVLAAVAGAGGGPVGAAGRAAVDERDHGGAPLLGDGGRSGRPCRLRREEPGCRRRHGAGAGACDAGWAVGDGVGTAAGDRERARDGGCGSRHLVRPSDARDGGGRHCAGSAARGWRRGGGARRSTELVQQRGELGPGVEGADDATRDAPAGCCLEQAAQGKVEGVGAGGGWRRPGTSAAGTGSAASGPGGVAEEAGTARRARRVVRGRRAAAQRAVSAAPGAAVRRRAWRRGAPPCCWVGCMRALPGARRAGVGRGRGTGGMRAGGRPRAAGSRGRPRTAPWRRSRGRRRGGPSRPARCVRRARPRRGRARGGPRGRHPRAAKSWLTAHLSDGLDGGGPGGLGEAEHRELGERAAQQPAQRQPQRAGDEQHGGHAEVLGSRDERGQLADQLIRQHRVDGEHDALLAGPQRLRELALDGRVERDRVQGCRRAGTGRPGPGRGLARAASSRASASVVSRAR